MRRSIYIINYYNSRAILMIELPSTFSSDGIATVPTTGYVVSSSGFQCDFDYSLNYFQFNTIKFILSTFCCIFVEEDG